MPRTLFPSLSKGGDQHIIPMTLGTTSRTAPETPDLAGRPTWRKYIKKHSFRNWQKQETWIQHLGATMLWLTWKANWPEKSYMPQECMRLRVLRTASALRTRSPVIGQIPPLASVAAMTLPDSQVTSIEHNWNRKIKKIFELEGHTEQF